jgi:hypothetical protein
MLVPLICIGGLCLLAGGEKDAGERPPVFGKLRPRRGTTLDRALSYAIGRGMSDDEVVHYVAQSVYPGRERDPGTLRSVRGEIVRRVSSPDYGRTCAGGCRAARRSMSPMPGTVGWKAGGPSRMQGMRFSHFDDDGLSVFVATGDGLRDVTCPTGETCKHACACSGVDAHGNLGNGAKCKCISLVKPVNPGNFPGLQLQNRGQRG